MIKLTAWSASTCGVPSALRRSDGTSVYVVAGSELNTSREIVAAEQAIVAAAARRDVHTIGADTINLALLESTANGIELDSGQFPERSTARNSSFQRI
jgi:hypothetical protein